MVTTVRDEAGNTVTLTDDPDHSLLAYTDHPADIRDGHIHRMYDTTGDTKENPE